MIFFSAVNGFGIEFSLVYGFHVLGVFICNVDLHLV